METGFVYYGNCRHTDGTIGSSSGEAGSRRPGDFQHIAAKRVVRAPLQETNTKKPRDVQTGATAIPVPLICHNGYCVWLFVYTLVSLILQTERRHKNTGNVV